MSIDSDRFTLRRWAAAKHITKAQLADLIDKGYITTLDDGSHRLTPAGTTLIKGDTTP